MPPVAESNQKLDELKEFLSGLTENQRQIRLAGSELEAALQDPRWQAKH